MPRHKTEAPKTKRRSGNGKGAVAVEVVNPGVNPAVEHTTPDKSVPFPIVAS